MTGAAVLTPSTGTYDAILEQLGQWRKYHIYNYILLFFASFLSGLYMTAFVFIAGEIDFRCQVPVCETLPERNWIDWAFPVQDNHPDKCNQFAANSNSSSDIRICTLDWFDNSTSVACSQFVYGLDGESSIVKDFNLGCQRWKRTLVGSAYKAGFFISISLSGIFSDRYGRKTALALSAFLKASVGVIRSFSNSYEIFIVLQFLESAIGGGLYISIFTLLMEIVLPKNRLLVQCIFNGCSTLGMATFPVISWLINDWRITLRAVYIPGVFVILYLWIIDESARWLLAKNRYKDAIRILKKAERINGVTIPESLMDELCQSQGTTNEAAQNLEAEKFIDSKSARTKKMSTIKNVLSSPIILKRTLACGFLWIACTFTFYGLSINSVRLTDNRHLSYILVCLMQIPGYITAFFIMDKIGRRKTLISAFIICGVGCVTSAFVPKDMFWVAIIPYIVAKFAISLVVATLYMYTSEIFPTSLRQSLLGTCLTLGLVGSTLAPQVQLIAYYVEQLPSILFGLLTLASGILSFTITETAKIKLPDTIEEAEHISTK